MKTFYVTFGQTHPLRDGWVEVKAYTEDGARERVFESFGIKWAFIYEQKEFKTKNFPLGKVGLTMLVEGGVEE